MQKNFAKNRRISFKHSKRLLLKHSEKLTDEEKDRVAIMLQASDELRLAYRLKELFYDVMGGFSEPIRINSRGWGTFSVNGGSVSAWVTEEAYRRLWVETE